MTDAGQTAPRRVAILSDTHGVLDQRVAGLVAQCDIAVHGGDIGGLAALADLAPLDGRIYAVFGNNDTPRSWPSYELPALRHLPELVQLALPGGGLVVIHGHQFPAKGRHAHLRRRFPEARAIVYGHSHRLEIDREARPWVLNPGAAGRARTYGGPSCLVLTASGEDWSLSVHRFGPVRRKAAARTDRSALSL